MHNIHSPKVSVIMPVYNTEAYLREAVDSVLAQTLSDWELIIVNDGSTDGSLSILNDYIAHDARIKLINQSNHGQSAARNKALTIAKGQYIYFLDSDDEIIPIALEQCYKNCEQHGLDVVFFDADTKYDCGLEHIEHSVSYSRKNTASFEVLDGITMMKSLLLTDEFLVSPCLVFSRRSFIDAQSFSFYEGIVHEDELYTSKLFLYASRVMYIPYRLFVRRLRSNSTMTSIVKLHNINSYFVVADSLRTLSNSNSKYAEVIDLYLTKTLNAVLWKAHRMPLLDRLKVFQKAIKDWSSYITPRSWAVLLFKNYLPKK